MQHSPLSARGGAATTAAMLAVAVLGAAPLPARAVLNVTVSQVGFPTDQGDAVRSGTWTPVIVDVGLEGQDAFDGTIRVGQVDIDGDICFDRVELHLQGENSTVRRYLYTLPNPSQLRSPMAVEVYDADGDVVQVVCNGTITSRCAPPGGTPYVISDDEALLLSVSSGVRGKVEDLNKAGDNLARAVRVAHMAPSFLPEHWIGLESVDYIVWDDADPDQLTPAQLEALIEWVRQGGTLLLAAARTAGKVSASPALREAIPVTLGEPASSNRFPQLRHKLLGFDEVPFKDQIPYVQCTAKPEAEVVHQEEKLNLPLLTRWRYDRGHVIFCGATLRDLFSAEGAPRNFFMKVLRLKQQSVTQGGHQPISLYNDVVSAVGFTTSGSIYLAVALIFSAAYIGVATFGAWGFLAHKGWKQHNWSAFALVAAAASVLSIIGVKTVQGVGYKVHQFSVVDAEAGQSYGRGTAWFGIRSGTDTSLDLWLPSNHLTDVEPGKSRCFLRPLPVGSDPLAMSDFADQAEYRLVPSNAVVEDVRLRATLKRLEGRWEGPLGGKIIAYVGVQGDSAHVWRITDDSYIVNNLGVDLRDCWLVQAYLGTGTGRYTTSGGRSENIYAYPLGQIPASDKKLSLATLCYGTPLDLKEYVAQHKLREEQQKWAATFTSKLAAFGLDDTAALPGNEDRALMLLSTVGDFDPKPDENSVFGTRTISRDRLRGLDLRDHLQRDCVYLIGFADEPGPMRVAQRRPGRGEFRPLEPVAGHTRTMYRIRIPVTLSDPKNIAAGPLPVPPKDGEEENPEESDDPEVIMRRGLKKGQ